MPHTPFVDQFFLAITWLGSLVVLLPCSIVFGIVLVRSGRTREALLLNVGLGVTTLVVHALKLAIKRPRPDIGNLLVAMPTDWSFPSGHAAQAAAVFFALALIALRTFSRSAAGLIVAAGVLSTLAVGYSRVYLQVHYVSDVLAGALVGGCAVMVAAIITQSRFR